MPWDDDLEEPGRSIAASDARRKRITAGPGSGKTFTMVRGVARLIEEQVNPQRILVCTFTRTAATDLRRELHRLGIEGCEAVRACTLHSYCFSLLARERVLEATGRVLRPLMDFEERFMIEDLKNATSETVPECNARLEACNAAWARLQSEDPGQPEDPRDQTFQQALDRWLRSHDGMLIGELVPITLRYLRDNPMSPESSTFEHVVVDEYQDLNEAEQALLDLLAEEGSLTVVGDPDQSIFGFKHAHPEGIADFSTRHPATEEHELDHCRRCPSTVVDMANHLIACNRGRCGQQLICCPGNPAGDVSIVQWDTIEDEAVGLSRFIRHQLESGLVEPKDVLVLSPRKQLGYAVRDKLTEMDIRAHSYFREQILDGTPKDASASAAQQAFSLLTLLVDRGDRVALRAWCGFGSPSLRSGECSRLMGHCREAGRTPEEALEAIVSGELSIPNTTGIRDRTIELRQRLGELNGLEG